MHAICGGGLTADSITPDHTPAADGPDSQLSRQMLTLSVAPRFGKVFGPGN